MSDLFILTSYLLSFMSEDKSDTYLTIDSPVESIFTEKRSKFLSFAYQVSDVEMIKTILEEIRKKYYDARHVCFAYRLGARGEEWRVNDDGEPSGTAGRPIYGQLLSSGLTYILIVIVRYFGGVKLGTGGLAVAYKNAAANVILAAKIVEKRVERLVKVQFNYPIMNDIMRIVKENNLSVVSQTNENIVAYDCSITVRVRLSDVVLLTNRLDLVNETHCGDIILNYDVFD